MWSYNQELYDDPSDAEAAHTAALDKLRTAGFSAWYVADAQKHRPAEVVLAENAAWAECTAPHVHGGGRYRPTEAPCWRLAKTDRYLTIRTWEVDSRARAREDRVL